MAMTERQVGGWSLFLGTIAVAVAAALSPGRGMVDTVPSTSLTELTLAMARNAALAYALPVVIICAALLMLHGLLTLRRYAGPVALAPAFAAMSVAGLLYMGLLGWRLAKSTGENGAQPH